MNEREFLEYTAKETMQALMEKAYSGESMYGEMPERISAEAAAEDIDYVRYVLENAYSGYDYYDKTLFDEAFEELALAVNTAEEMTQAQLIELIHSHLSFITDGHLELTTPEAWVPFHQTKRTFVSDMPIIEKEGELYSADTGERVSFDEPVRTLPTIPKGREKALLIGIRSKGEPTDITVTLGEKQVKLPVHRIKSAKKTELILHKERCFDDVAIVTSNHFGSDYEKVKGELLEIGKKCREYKHVIWDLSNNGGGDSRFPDEFLTGLNGGVDYGGMKCSTMHSAVVNAKLTGEISEMEKHFTDEEDIPKKDYDDLFEGALHVIINDDVVSSGEWAVSTIKRVPRAVLYGCNTAGVCTFGDVTFYRLPNSRIILGCPYKIFDIGAKETIGFEPDYWIDDEDPVSVVLEHIKKA